MGVRLGKGTDRGEMSTLSSESPSPHQFLLLPNVTSSRLFIENCVSGETQPLFVVGSEKSSQDGYVGEEGRGDGRDLKT